MAFARGPKTVTDGLVLYLDATNPKSQPYNGFTAVTPGNATISNGSLVALSTTLPNGITGFASKLTAGTFTNTVVVRNQQYNCEGDSIFEVFIKPVEYFYVKLRDGDTTNLQVDFDLVNGTIVGGNNASNGTITPYPNGWFLLTMRINRTSSFNYGTRIVLYPTDSFLGYDSTPGSGALIYKPIVKSLSNNVIKDLSGNNNTARLVNGTELSTNAFNFDGIDDYMDVGSYVYTNYTQHTAITIFNSNNINAQWSEILQKGQRRDFAIRQFSTTGRLDFRYITNDGTYSYDNFTLQNNTWYIAAMSIDTESGGKFKCYINGSKLYETSITTATTLYEDQIYTGQIVMGRIFPSIEWFDGKIAASMMYERQLSDVEINQNYNALKSRYGL